MIRSVLPIGLAMIVLIAVGCGPQGSGVAPPQAAQPQSGSNRAFEQLVATAVCSPTGNRYREVRFNLSAPGTVAVTHSSEGANWWIKAEPTGTIVARMNNGKLNIGPPQTTGGGTLHRADIPLTPGTYVLHSDCRSPTNASDEASIQVPPAPEATGPAVQAVAAADSMPFPNWQKGYNDRLFILTLRQKVTVLGAGGKSNGYIEDFQRIKWWTLSTGELVSPSTLDLMPGAYCLHVDWQNPLPDQFRDQWEVRYIGPAEPTGARRSVMATYDPSITGKRYVTAAFTLPAAQIIELRHDTRGQPGASIVDNSGLQWYLEIDGIVTSGSALVGGPDAVPRKIPLPAGTYLLWPSGTEWRNDVTAVFVGSTAPTFDPPPVKPPPCLPSTKVDVPIPAAKGPTLTPTPTRTPPPRPAATIPTPTPTPTRAPAPVGSTDPGCCKYRWILYHTCPPPPLGGCCGLRLERTTEDQIRRDNKQVTILGTYMTEKDALADIGGRIGRMTNIQDPAGFCNGWQGDFDGKRFHLGALVNFGTGKVRAPAPDADGDGVPDQGDKCPGKGTAGDADAWGCPCASCAK